MPRAVEVQPRKVLLWASLLVVATFIAYLPAIRAGTIWDDDFYVTANPTLRDLDGLRRIWLEPTATPQYYPLVFSAFWLEYHLWQLHPLGYHAVNVMLHALTALLVAVALGRLAVPGAWFAAAVFALHPVHVESVAWITERKNVLSGAFYLAAFLCYMAYMSPPETPAAGRGAAARRRTLPPPASRRTLYVLSIGLFVCALLSKTVTSTLPAVLLLVLWWKRDRLGPREIAPLLPLFALGIASGLTTAWIEKHHVGARGFEWSFSALERVLIAGRALWFYLGKLLLPVKLTFIYPRWQLDATALWQWCFPAGVAAALAGLWLLRGRFGKGPLVAALFFCGTLFPALGFFDVYPMRYSFVADHFQYLASLGPLALGGALLARGVARSGPAAGRLAPPAGAAALALLGVLTWRQGFIYKDAETLWRDTIAKNPDAGMAHDNLANILQARGQSEEAVAHYREALRVKPFHVEAHNNMGSALVRLNRPEEAITHFKEAVRLAPRFAEAHFNMGVAYAVQGKAEEAAAAYRRAVELKPTHAQARNNLGSLLDAQGKTAEAMEQFLAAARSDPAMAEPRCNLGHLLLRTGRLDEAAAHYAEALRLRPGYAAAGNGLGLVYTRQGRTEEAIAAFRSALASNESWIEPLRNLAWILATHPDPERRDGSEAVRLAERACRQSRDSHAGALDALAAAYAETGRYAEAVRTAEKARERARATGQSALAGAIVSRIESYRLNRPFRDTSPGPGA